MEAMFAQLDTAKKGKIGAAEIIAALSHLDPNVKAKLPEFMAEYGKKAEDTLTLEEFAKGGRTKLGFCAKFICLDKDKDGKLNFDEFSVLPKTRFGAAYDEAKARGIFTESDTDKDGFLSIRELGELVKAHAEPAH